ncbi:MAG: amidohydrolase [Candidatus Micrarchaeota archaeon]|nr:amidohydrolase [Candidatus Micrarchaeota archaeon]
MPLIYIKNGLCVDSEKIAKINFLVDSETGKIIENQVDKTDYVINAENKLIFPGFVNTHTHIAMSVFRNYADDLLLHDWLQNKIWPLEKKLTYETVYHSSIASIVEMARCGTTMFNDMYGFCDAIAEATKKTGLRAIIGYGMIDSFEEEKREKELKQAEKYRKYIQDLNKTEDDLINFAYCPHAVYTCSPELIKEAKVLAKKNNSFFHMHASETRKEVFECKKKYGKTPIELLHDLGVLDNRTLLAHCCFITLKEIKLLQQNNASVAHCVISNMKLANGEVAPVHEMLVNNVNITLGTDGPASNNSLNIIETAKMASIVQKNYKWSANILLAKEVFDFLTINAYKAFGKKGGLIKNNYLADIIIVDYKKANTLPLNNPYSTAIYSMNPTNIETVIVNGKLIMNEHKFVNIDEHYELEKFNNIATKFLEQK